MKIKGLTNEETFILSRNIGNQDSGFKATDKPKKVAYIINKALKAGSTDEEIAKIIGINATTMIYRHIYIFENLHKDLQSLVIYGSSLDKKDRESKGYITFQVANELSRIKEEYQKQVHKFITENKIYGWNDTKSIRELLEINDYKDIEKIFKTMLERRGADNHHRIGDELNLEDLNKKIFKLGQNERDKVFKKIAVKAYSEDKIKKASLGYRYYEIVFEKSSISLSLSEVDKRKEKLIEGLKKYK